MIILKFKFKFQNAPQVNAKCQNIPKLDLVSEYPQGIHKILQCSLKWKFLEFATSAYLDFGIDPKSQDGMVRLFKF